MKNKIEKVSLQDMIEESVRYEKNAMVLYQLFSEIFSSDKKFWKCLAGEEQYHAELVGSLKYPLDAGALPEGMLYDNLAKLQYSNQLVEDLIVKFSRKHPSREEAFKCALAMETTGSEMVFQRIMLGKSENKIIKTFKEMAGFCKDHARRIAAWMKTNDIRITEEK